MIKFIIHFVISIACHRQIFCIIICTWKNLYGNPGCEMLHFHLPWIHYRQVGSRMQSRSPAGRKSYGPRPLKWNVRGVVAGGDGGVASQLIKLPVIREKLTRGVKCARASVDFTNRPSEPVGSGMREDRFYSCVVIYSEVRGFLSE